jgi:hypothetical protein
MIDAKAYPLAWPDGWPRTSPARQSRAKFKTGRTHYGESGSWISAERLTIATATRRVTDELKRMGARAPVISTNLVLRQDGLPRSGQSAPRDVGVAVYWTDRNKQARCMAIDRYDRVEDNLAAIAATLDAMRAIDRHGGAQILDRAFSGFVALPAPAQIRDWRDVLGLRETSITPETIKSAYRMMRSRTHPDREGGSPEAFGEVQRAYEDACVEKGIVT